MVLDKDESGSERTCIVTRLKNPPEMMIRFVAAPAGTVVPDIRRRLPGRGVWVEAREAAVAEAVRKQAFSRAFKTKLTADPALPAMVGDLLAADALQSFAMANKAGLVTTGFAKVEAALAAGHVVALVHASEAADDGIRKLDAAWRRASDPDRPPRSRASVKVFSAEQLELALGRTNVIHAALAPGPASQAFLARCQRLISYRFPARHDQDIDFEGSQAEAPTAVAGRVQSFGQQQDQSSV